MSDLRPGVKVLRADPREGWVPGRVGRVTGGGEGARVLIDGETYVVDQVHLVDKEVETLVSRAAGGGDLTDICDYHDSVAHQAVKACYLSGHCTLAMGEDMAIVVNPYTTQLPRGPIYSAARAREHLKAAGSTARGPPAKDHPYALASKALRNLERGLSSNIIVTGESGAGKTETAKGILEFFGEVTGAHGAAHGLHQRVLRAGLLLEVLGSAKTARNDNSSRFGRHITLHFAAAGGGGGAPRLVGAAINTYLLERSRVVSHAATDRSFHIFYALLDAPDAGLRARLLGQGRGAKDFRCLRPGASSLARGISDAANFDVVQRGLEEVGMPRAEQEDRFWRVIAGVLHVMNVDFAPRGSGGDGCVVQTPQEVERAAALLGLDAKALLAVLTTSTMKEPGRNGATITTELTVVKAAAVRDGVATYLFARLFDTVVERCNATLRPTTSADGATVALLDLFGFEQFDANYFEQLLINYANEAVQNAFYTKLFTELEQTCRDEGVAFKLPRISDNRGCLDLLEGSKAGVLRHLEDTCKLSGLKASDDAFLSALKARYIGPMGQKLNPYFTVPKPPAPGGTFIVTHYAGSVEYKVDGAVAKNKGALRGEVIAALKRSGAAAVRDLAEHDTDAAAGTYVTQRFKQQLRALVTTLTQTEVYWVRCIKPNDAKQPGVFDGALVLRQLHHNAIIPTLRLLRSGPRKFTFDAFLDVFGLLGRERIMASPYASTFKGCPSLPAQFRRDLCTHIRDAAGIPPEQFQAGGLRFVFVIPEALAVLHGELNTRLAAAAAEVQAVGRAFRQRFALFTAHRKRTARLVQERRKQEAEARAASLERLDAERRATEAKRAAARVQTHAHVVQRMGMFREVEDDRRAYMKKAHKQIEIWEHTAQKAKAAWAEKERQWGAEASKGSMEERVAAERARRAHAVKMKEVEKKTAARMAWAQEKQARNEEAAVAKQRERSEREAHARVKALQSELDSQHAAAQRLLRQRTAENRRLEASQRALNESAQREKMFSAADDSRRAAAHHEAAHGVRKQAAAVGAIDRRRADVQWAMQKTLWQQREAQQAVVAAAALTPRSEPRSGYW